MIKCARMLTNSLMLLTVLFLADNSIAGEFAVSPMMIELEGSPRETKEFSFTLFGKSNTNVKLALFDMNQLETGYMGFLESSASTPDSFASWIEFEDTNYRLREDESVKVNGIIKVPSRASGNHQIAIMMEEDVPEDAKGGISVKIRYAVVLTLDIDGRSSERIKTRFEELAVVEREDGTYLEGFFKNDSAVTDWLFSQVQLRGEDNRLLERVQMKTQSAWQRADAGSRIFPGARVRLYGKITKPVAGQYNVMVRNEFSGKAQPVYRDVFTLNTSETGESGEAIAAAGADGAASMPEGEVMINPDAVAVDIRGNGTSFASFYVINNKAEPVKIKFPASMSNLADQGIESFQFYPDNVEIQPRMKTRVVLRQNHLSDSAYGNIRFQASMEGVPGKTVLEIPTIAGL